MTKTLTELYAGTIEKLASINPDWQHLNICRTEVSKREYGYPVFGRTYFGPHDMPDGNGGRRLTVLYDYVGQQRNPCYYQFIIPHDGYPTLKQNLLSGGIQIRHTDVRCFGSCPWWKKIRFSLRVPSDRFITLSGQVILYDQIADQMEMF
ncbi:MAG: hypothetical protein AAFV93_09580 [Chloroflexota bacterium]